MGTNGQQIALPALHPGTKVRIIGTNQHNQRVEWDGAANNKGETVTWGWWWKGNVEIFFGGTGPRLAQVPTVFVADVYRLDFKNHFTIVSPPDLGPL
jgi:hypothetical protein